MTSIEPWPTEAAATAAVKAAAIKAYENAMKAGGDIVGAPDYDDLPEPTRRQVEEDLLPLVWAALQAIPDPRYAAWEQGLYCGLRQGYEDDNPYPSGV